MAGTQGFLVADFTGGRTDYVYNTNPNKYQFADNFVLNRNGQMELRPGFEIYNTTAYQIPDGAVRVQALIPTYNDDFLYIQSSRKIWYISSGSFIELTGPTSNPAIGAGTTSSYIDHTEWNKHVYVVTDAFAKPIKIFPNASNVPVVRNAGLPDLATAPTVTAGGAGANSYIYTFLYYYTYQIGTVTFEDFGPTTQVTLSSAAAPNISTVAITAIPVLANSTTENWDTTTITVKIYRTTNGGTTSFYLGQVTNGTTIYNDSASDTTIQSNVGLYTNGGVVDNDPPPPAKFIHVVNGKAYYGFVKEGSQEIPNRVVQSLIDDPDSVPATFFVTLEDEVTGLSSFNGKPIVFGKTKTYRLDGEFDETGQGSITYEAISTNIGCISHQSIVRTREGVFFAGNDGFYFTNGFLVQKISDSLNETYKTFTDTATKKKRIYGTYDSIENRVFWTAQFDTSSSDNDGFFILDLRQGVKPESVFTTASNGTNLAPTSLAFYQGYVLHGDRRGYIFKNNQTIDQDLKVDTSVVPSSWSKSTIIYNYTSVLLDCGSPQLTKWGQWLHFKAKNTKNLSMQPYSINDSSFVPDALKEIRSRTAVEWGDPSVFSWGSSEGIPWGFAGHIEERRRFPAGSLRFRAKQIKFTNSFTNIYRSDNIGLADVDGSANTVTLNSGNWPTEIVDYYISFETDSYVANFLITAVSGGTITLEDIQGNVPTASDKKWVIRGYRKGEKIFPIQYSIFYAPIGTRSSNTYHGTASEDGLNA